MSSKKIYIIQILMLLTICSLFVTQAYWFKKSFDLQEKQLDEKINIALRNVAHHLLLANKDTSSKIIPISKISSNEFFVKTKSYFSLNQLDSVIKQEFKERGITLNFDYIILKSENEVILSGNTLSDFSSKKVVACKSRNEDKELRDFKVRLNHKTVYLLNSMGIWMYSSLTLLAILAIFTFIMISILKGKKLANLKKDFVNNMTHELKTPIANISIASEALKNKNIQMDESKMQKYAEIIHKENIRLHLLVDKVLQISTMEKKEENYDYEQVDVHELLKNCVQSFGPILEKRKGTLETNLKATDFNLQADKTHLNNVFYNLIDNAIKYSLENPEIKIESLNVKNGITIQVSDKGIGISKENKIRVFQKFFREETGNLHNTKGFGLGLSYAKLIIEKHKGSISFESSKNNGSIFTVYLPTKL